MNQSWKKEACRFWLAAMLGLAVAGTALAEEEDTSKFVQGTTVNGLGISDMTVDEAAGHIVSFYSSEYKLTIKEEGGAQEEIQGSQIGFAVGLPEGYLQDILQKQNEAGRVFGPDVDNKYRIELQNTFDNDALTGQINGLNCISGSGIVTTEDAHVTAYEEGQPFTIVPEVRGNNVDLEKTAELIRNAVTSGTTEVDLVAAGCYYEPKMTADSEELKTLCDTMNQCREMSITYTFGEGVSEVLEPATLCSWLLGTSDGQIQVNRDQAAAYVKTLAEKYDTAGTQRTFHTATGRDVTLTGPYGWQINQAAEVDGLIGAIQTGQTQTREPVYAIQAAGRNGQDWGATYVEVDLSGQHAYMVKDGAVVWDAPCVTGNAAKNHNTPAGIYSLTYKQRDRVLRGAKKADGTYEYESPVSYWMPFNGGIGLHDASWRGSFGGSIYKTNGSHGCVNLPSSKAAALYDLVYKGMPVICYQ